MFEAIILIVPLPFMIWAPPEVTQWVVIASLLICLPGMLVMRGGAPFVATPKHILKTMLKFADIKRGETVIDAGCGDGRMVLEAAKLGANAIGYELSIPTFLVAKIRTLLHSNAHILFRNFWKQDYRNADVVFCYLLRDTMQTFEQTIWPTLKPGARVVSHVFRFKNVEPDREENGALLYTKR